MSAVLPMPTKEQIDAMTSPERVQFAQSIRSRMITKEEVPEEHLHLALYAVRKDRSAGGGKKKKAAKAAAPSITLEDI